ADDHAGAQRTLAVRRTASAALAAVRLVAEKAAKQIVVGQLKFGRRHARFPVGVDGDNGGRANLADVGVGVTAAGDGVRQRRRLRDGGDLGFVVLLMRVRSRAPGGA